jgi:hypothetical protein
MDEDWDYEELDEHTSGDCTCHDELALPQGGAGMDTLGAGALRSFADQLDGLAAGGWELEGPVPEEGTLRLVRR